MKVESIAVIAAMLLIALVINYLLSRSLKKSLRRYIRRFLEQGVPTMDDARSLFTLLRQIQIDWENSGGKLNDAKLYFVSFICKVVSAQNSVKTLVSIFNLDDHSNTDSSKWIDGLINESFIKMQDHITSLYQRHVEEGSLGEHQMLFIEETLKHQYFLKSEVYPRLYQSLKR